MESSLKEPLLSYHTPIASQPDISSIKSKNLEAVRSVTHLSTSLQHMFNLESKELLSNLNNTVTNLSSHSDPIKGLAFNINSSLLASASNDKSIKIWDLPSKSEVCTLNGHTEYVNTVCFSKDSRYLLSGSCDYTIKVWNLESYSLENSLNAHSKDIWSVQFNSGDSIFSSSSSDGTIKIWSFPSLSEILCISCKDVVFYSAVFTSDSDFLITGSDDSILRVWDLKSSSVLHTFIGHSDFIRSVALSPDGSQIASSSKDKSIRIWNFHEKSEEFALIGHTELVRSVAFSPDGKLLVSGSADKLVKVWNIKSRKEIYSLQGHSDQLWAVAFAGNGKLIASGAECIKLWDLEFQGFEVEAVDVNRAAVRTWDNKVKLWGSEICIEGGTENCVRAIALGVEHLACGFTDGVVKVFKLVNLEEVLSAKLHKFWVNALDFGDDSKIAAGATDGLINIWDFSRNSEEESFDNQWPVLGVKYCKSNRKLASSSMFGVKIWNLSEKNVEVWFSESCVRSLSFTPDGKYLAGVNAYQDVVVWDIEDARVEKRETNENQDSIIIEFLSNSVLGKFNRNKSEKEYLRVNTGKETDHQEGKEFMHLADSELKEYFKESHIVESLKYKSYDEIGKSMLAIHNKILEYSGLHLLAYRCETKTIEALEKSGMLALSTDNYQHTALFYAFEGSDLSTLQSLLRYIKEITKQDYSESYQEIISCVKADSFEILTSENFTKVVTFFKALCNTNTVDILIDTNYRLDYNGISTNWADVLLADLIQKIESSDIQGFNDQFNILFPYFYRMMLLFENKKGLVAILKHLLASNTYNIFTPDELGQSSIYYIIEGNQHECTSMIVDYLVELSKSNNLDLYYSRFSEIGRYILLIIQKLQHSSFLIDFLDACIYTNGSTIFAAPLSKLPIVKLATGNPSLLLFINPSESQGVLALKIESIPFKLSPITSNQILSSIIDCPTEEVFQTKIIKYLILSKWQSSQPWIYFYTLLLWSNLILLGLVFSYYQNLPLMIAFISVNSLLLIWELIQMFQAGLEYFKDGWNKLDIVRMLNTFSWITLRMLGHKNLFLTWFTVLFNVIRAITGFRAFDQTRYYVRLIFMSLSNITSFLYIFIYSTLCFGFLAAASQDSNSLDFSSLWNQSFLLAFGDLPNDTSDMSLYYITFFLTIIINVILMLNLIISILGDSFDEFQLKAEVYDFKEMAQVILEIEEIKGIVYNNNEAMFVHGCNYANEEQEGGWQGKMNEMKKFVRVSEERSVQDAEKLAEDVKEVKKMMETVNLRVAEQLGDTRKSINGLESRVNGLDRKLDQVLLAVKKK